MELKMNMASVQEDLERKPSRQAAGDEGVCVLVVEDDDADAYLIERALSADPHIGGIIRATDGVEALHLVEIGAIQPDLALIDLHMPRKSGFHLLVDFAARRDPCFPMVVLTSSTAPIDAMRSRLRGAARVLTKPATLEELTDVLTAAVDAACRGVTLPSKGGRAPRRRTAFDNSPPRPKGQRVQPLN
jgi:CheY-like chemotaxis protein